MPKSLSRKVNQVISAVAWAIARYSASELDRDIVLCFFAHQDMMLDSKKVQYPVVERRIIGHPAQSASQKDLMCKSEVLEKKSSFPSDPLIY